MKRHAHRHSCEVALRRPLAFGVTLTVVWWGLIVVLSYTLPRLSPHSFPSLGSTIINLILFAVVVTLVIRCGWRGPVGLGAPHPDRNWLFLVPLLVGALSFAARGLVGTPTQFMSSAVLFLALGLNEELLYRGVIQHATDRLGAVRSVVSVALLFGLGHFGNAVFFGQPLFETVAQVISATAFGLAYSAVRLHLMTIWPLAVLHGLEDFCNTRSLGTTPSWWYAVIAAYYAGYAAWLLIQMSRREGSVRPGAGEAGAHRRPG